MCLWVCVHVCLILCDWILARPCMSLCVLLNMWVCFFTDMYVVCMHFVCVCVCVWPWLSVWLYLCVLCVSGVACVRVPEMPSHHLIRTQSLCKIAERHPESLQEWDKQKSCLVMIVACLSLLYWGCTRGEESTTLLIHIQSFPVPYSFCVV